MHGRLIDHPESEPAGASQGAGRTYEGDNTIDRTIAPPG
jgi:hypothetical protein